MNVQFGLLFKIGCLLDNELMFDKWLMFDKGYNLINGGCLRRMVI